MHEAGILNDVLHIAMNAEHYLFTLHNMYMALAIVCIIIFCETGFVVTAFLPGDSLLFASGALIAARIPEALWVVCLCVAVAAILGNLCNYIIGRFIGKKLLASRYHLVKAEHLKKTENFYIRYGSKTLVLARFIPYVRTLAPFLAGIVNMNYRIFMIYNIVGGVLWVLFCTIGGFFFGNLPFVKDNMHYFILWILFMSVTIACWSFIKARGSSRQNKAEFAPLSGD